MSLRHRDVLLYKIHEGDEDFKEFIDLFICGKLERKITHVTLQDRVRCEDLRRSTGMRDASNLAERLKWK